MSKTLLKIAALLLAIAMLFSFAACGTKGGDESTTNTTEAQDAIPADDSADDATDPDDAAAPSEQGEAVTSETNTQAEDASATDPSEEDTSATENTVDGKDNTPADNQGSTPADGKTSDKGNTGTTERKLSFDPNNAKSVLDFYTMVTKKSEAPKTGFHKERVGTFTDKPDIGGIMSVLPKDINPMDLVCKFMSIKDGSVDKSYVRDYQKGVEGKYGHKALQTCKLTMNDVKSVTCKINGDVATITIKLKDGSSDKKTDISKLPLEKCGICSGTTDKNYYDHQNAQIMNDAYGAATYNEKYNNATVVAKINVKTEQFVDLKITFHTEVDINLVVKKLHAAGNISVSYTKFVY